MFLYSVIPLTKLPRPQPQVVSYFSTSDLVRGQLVEVPLGRRKVTAVIIDKLNAQEQKQAIRTSPYALKSISRALSTHAVVPASLIQTALELSRHYYEPLGLVLARALPDAFTKPTAPFLKQLKELTLPPYTAIRQKGSATLLISSHEASHSKKEFSILVSGYRQKAKNGEEYRYDGSLTPTQRRTLWLSVAAGTIRSISGTRNAVFLPMAKPGSLIIDGENNTSLVSWDQHPKIDARFVAQLRREHEGYDVLMRESIPSVQTWHRAHQEKWALRREESSLAPLTLIDMRTEMARANTSLLSKKMAQRLADTKKGEKVFLYMHRRGVASAIVCRDCGYVVRCEKCELALVQHGRTLLCHHCGTQRPAPNRCAPCGGSRLKQIGGGTERLEEEVRTLAPHLRLVRIDSDNTASPKERDDLFSAFRDGDVDVLIGTSMALRESDLPSLTWSGVVMMDGIANLPFYRATEEAFSVLWRLRTHTKENVYVQTYLAELPLFAQAGEPSFDLFMQSQLAVRSILKWPPFSHIIHLVYGHRDRQTAQRIAEAMQKKLEEQGKFIALPEGVQILGPSPALGASRRGTHRWYILLKWPIDSTGAPINMSKRNRLLSVVGPDWDITVDPIDIP